MHPITRFLVPVCLSAGLLAGVHAADSSDPASYARPLCGTAVAQTDAGANNTFPGATAPLGMIQWSPDTEDGMHRGGYYDQDHRISQFSLDHLSGVGCINGENFGFMPLLQPGTASPGSNRTAFATGFSHQKETATPGFYAVTLDNGIKVELTTTLRTGFGRFHFPAGAAPTLSINAASAVPNGKILSSIKVDPAAHAVSGSATGGRFCRGTSPGTMYFYAVFDRPFASWSTWSGPTLAAGSTAGQGPASGAFLTFDAAQGRTVLAKVSISYVSAENARANIEAESPTSAFASDDFDRSASAARAEWNRWLGKIAIEGGTRDEKVTFYSMLYHALMGPNVVSDANGDYLGYDGRTHRAEGGHLQYSNISGWDIYRSECQLLAMIAPEQASDLAQSLLLDYQQGGTFPRWGVPTGDTGVMMGDPAAPMIADIYAFGARHFDAGAALKGLVRAANDPSVFAPRTRTHERDALADYLKLGYVPEHQVGGYGNVSMTLEYASADYALAQFASALGDKDDADQILRHANNWRKLYNPATGYLQMRRRDGSWAPGFANNTMRYDNDRAYVEGTAGQYLWMVPFDAKGLADLLGGPAAATKRLDAFFTQLNVGSKGPESNLAWMGNEPCLDDPWLYDFWGHPDKAQGIVRRVMNELYGPGDLAYPGNDDVGEMSSWYVFAALGMYPELPGSDVLVLGSPLFPRTVIHLAQGDLTIVGHGASKDAPYVRSLKVNGQPWDKPWLRYSDLSHGATLDYRLARTPQPAWGSAPADAPPSVTN